MRLFLVIAENSFYIPNFLAGFLRQTPDQVVGAALVTKTLPKNDLQTYLIRHWYYLTPREMLKLVAQRSAMAVKDRVLPKSAAGPFYSVRAVLAFHHIETFEVQNDINRPLYLDRIRRKEPDVLVSSNPLIFKEEILRIPRICCLNRHSALLPAYGGLWPVFQALRNGEAYTGATVHTMERKIDGGIILARRKVPIGPGATVAGLYEETYRVSVEALLEALDKIRANELAPLPQNGFVPSYYSFPTREHWEDFRRRGARFI